MTAMEQALWSSCVALTRERGLARVRVADICRRAGVHRGTFYKHFESRDDLVERGTARLVTGVMQGLQAPDLAIAERARGGVPTNLTALMRFASLHRDQLAIVCDEANGFAFREALEVAVREQILGRLGVVRRRAEVPPDALIAAWSAAALMGALRWWVTQQPRPRPEIAARWLGRLLTDGVWRAAGVVPAGRERG